MKTTFILSALLILTASFVLADLKPVDTDDAVSFSVKNFGIGTKGTLKGLKGSIKWDAANTTASSFNVSADVNTISTGIDGRDSHLKKEEYFNAAKYPTLSFSSTSITGTSGAYNVTGNLTIKGVTKPVTFPFTVTASGNDFLFEGNFTINRRDFNVGGGSMVLGNDVKVTLKVKATS